MTMPDAPMTSEPDGKQIEGGGWDGSMNESPLGDGTDFLFDLTRPDPETKNLAADHPEKVAELRRSSKP